MSSFVSALVAFALYTSSVSALAIHTPSERLPLQSTHENHYTRNQIILDRGSPAPLQSPHSPLVNTAPTRIISLGSPIDASIFHFLLQQHHLYLPSTSTIEHHTYATSDATIQDLESQLSSWQAVSDTSTSAHTAVISIGPADVGLRTIHAACSPPSDDGSSAADDYQCALASADAFARVADRSTSPETLRNMLGNILFRACVFGRAQAAGSHREADKRAFRLFVVGHASPSAQGQVAGVVDALNEALRESVVSVNEDFGFEIAVFVDSMGGRRADGGWAHWMRR